MTLLTIIETWIILRLPKFTKPDRAQYRKIARAKQSQLLTDLIRDADPHVIKPLIFHV